MSLRHPLPYGFAKAHNLLLQDDGQERVLWASDAAAPSALGEVLRSHGVNRVEREEPAVLAQRIALAYAGRGGRGRKRGGSVAPAARPAGR